ncbi:disease resistance protein RGA2-like [Gossypium australe]|uniref:Disease resistance protein RGA2-like n=1 Tax=Gossypium australe TaxID=47621 RepID=A0A5B6WF77_9ROSI|nr:disease resistance protein RGA2-like [Gossypium australe]
MADAVICVALEVALSRAVSILEDQINLAWDFKDELNKGENSIDEPVKVWLEQLRDTAYEADDVLDELAYEHVRRKVDNQMSKKVSNFFSLSKNPIAFTLKMSKKVKNIDLSIKDINRLATDFGLQKRLQISSPVSSRVGGGTHSFGDSSRVVGREADVLKIVDLLIGSTTHQSLSRTSIVGMTEMLESLSGRTRNMKNKNAILENIQNELEGKTYLLVLDDVWDEDIKIWEDLRDSFLGINESRQSCILVTSRNENVAVVRETPLDHRHHLKAVVGEECWSIIKERAFGNSSISSESEVIERDIARKCGGDGNCYRRDAVQQKG